METGIKLIDETLNFTEGEDINKEWPVVHIAPGVFVIELHGKVAMVNIKGEWAIKPFSALSDLERHHNGQGITTFKGREAIEELTHIYSYIREAG